MKLPTLALYLFVFGHWMIPVRSDLNKFILPKEDAGTPYGARMLAFLKTMSGRIGYSRTLNLIIPESENHTPNGGFLKILSDSYMCGLRISTYSRKGERERKLQRQRSGTKNIVLLHSADDFP